MSKGLKICNLDFEVGKNPEKFEIDGYKFFPINEAIKEKVTYTNRDFTKYHRKHKVTCKVIVPKKQNDSIIFKGGRITQKFSESQTGRKRKFIEDILLIISLLIGRNVVLYSRKNFGQFPVIPFKNLKQISSNSDELRADLSIALRKIKTYEWQRKFNNGFHLIMLYYHANILHDESRFLANFVIWEWLYAHIYGKESGNLREIISSILHSVWMSDVDQNIYNASKHNIFSVLRNQLAHSGRLPINRPYAKTWMKQLSSEDIRAFFDFFNTLTQVLVMKTINPNCENRIDSFNTSLKHILEYGKL